MSASPLKTNPELKEKIESIVFDDVPACKNVWGDERSLLIIYQARNAFAQSIETLRSRKCADDSPESLLDFQILTALFAEELGIIARAIKKNYVTTQHFEWIDEQEDSKIEKEIVDTLVKFETLKYHFP